MITSPSLLSLRRKRSTRSEENSGSPSIKKSSPNPLEAKKEPPSTPKAHTSHRSKNSTRPALRTSPRLAKGKSANKSESEGRNFHTPVSCKHTHGSEENLRHASPDMPFLSSQLSGTQDCEVVWDCDSPGFSKDDLKRMHSSGDKEGAEREVVITQAPPRQLFPQNRSRVSRASSSGNTTAQLNDLLDFLSSKENEERRKRKQREADLLKTLEVEPPKETQSEGTSSCESFVLPKPLRVGSSQPFEVEGVCGVDKGSHNTTNLNDVDESVWGEDLNLALCDINESLLGEAERTVTNGSKRSSNVSADTSRSRVTSDNAEVSSTSMDIFDDDLFSDSVILSTQAVEEAMTINKSPNVNNKNNSSTNHTKGSKELRNIIIEDQVNGRIDSVNSNTNNITNHALSKVKNNEENVDSDSQVKRQVRRSFRFGGSPKDKTKSGNSDISEMNSVRNSTVNRSKPSNHTNINSSSAVNSNNQVGVNREDKNSDDQPHRQVRRSFRFGESPKDVSKSVPSAEITRQKQNSAPETHRQQTTSDPRKPNQTHSLNTQSLQNQNVSNLINNKVTKPSMPHNTSTQNSQLPLTKPANRSNTNPQQIPRNNKSVPYNTNTQTSQLSTIRELSFRSNTNAKQVNQINNKPSVPYNTNTQTLQVPLSKPLLTSNTNAKNNKPHNTNTQTSQLPGVGQHLFRSNTIPRQEDTRSRGNTLGTRGPLLRSQSSGNARIATSSPIARRSNSSMELDTSEDLGDEDFFKSFLSTLPEEMGGIGDSSAAERLSPIVEKHKSSTIGKPLLDLRGISKNQIKTSNASLQSVSHGSVRHPLQFQGNTRPGFSNTKVNQPGKRPTLCPPTVQGVKHNVTTVKTQPLDMRDQKGVGSVEELNSDTFDDGLFEDDVLSLIDEVESQYGSQNAPCEPSPSPHSSQPQVKCTQDEIAAKKAAALKRREDKRRQQCK